MCVTCRERNIERENGCVFVCVPMFVCLTMLVRMCQCVLAHWCACGCVCLKETER